MPHPDETIDPKFHKQMNLLAHGLDELFNGDAKGADRKVGFVLGVFEFGGDNSRFNYISNGTRADIVSLLKEMVARFEGQPELSGRA